MYNVHVFGTFNVLRAAWAELAKTAPSGGGRVVVTASAAGVAGTPNLSEYSAGETSKDISSSTDDLSHRSV